MPVLLCGIALLSCVLFVGILGVVRPQVILGPVGALWERTFFGTVRRRLTVARDQLTGTLGPWGAFAVLAGAGITGTVVVGWPFGGAVFKLGQDSVDWPVYNWVAERRFTGDWADMMAIVTQMGDRPVTRWFAIVSAVVCVILARRRWQPVLLIAAIYVATFWMQLGLGDLVDRGHPPTNPGTYPSGSTMRILAQNGFAVFLVFQYAKERGLRFAANPRFAIAAGTVITAAAVVQGYSRIDLMRHWITDVAGGWVVALCLLSSFVFAARAVLPPAASGAVRQEPAVAHPRTEPWFPDGSQTPGSHVAGTGRAP